MTRKKLQRGSALVETAVLMFPLTLLFLGVTTLGFDLATSVHAAQVTRDVGSMYVRGVNFSATANQDLAVRLGTGLGLQRTAGDGVIYMSKITFISRQTCTALALSPCNADRLVITQRVKIGNSALRPSAIGTPNAYLLNSEGLVSRYKEEASAVADIPGMVLPEGEFAYITESYFDVPRVSIWGNSNARGVYNRVIF
jgi:hypothetical protein